MKQMHKMMVVLAVVSLTALLLLSYGCRDNSSQTSMVPVTDAGSAPVAATPDTSGAGAGGGTMFAELANPQSDDQGNYVPLPRDENYSLMGYASGQRPVAHVMVNNVEADTFAANYQPYGAPSGFSPIGFRVPLTLGPDTLVTVNMTDTSGYQETMVFHPDAGRSYARVHQLWQGSQDDPYANLRMANTFVVEGDYRDAYVRYHRCIGLDVGFVWGPFFMGVALYDNDRYDDAMWQFRHCGRMDSGFYMANYEVGQCYERRGDYGDAIVEYQVVLGSRPDFVEAHWSLGESYGQRGNWSGAAAQYRQAIQYNPQFAPAHRGLGESLAHQGQWASAATSLNTAAKLNPRDARTHADLSATLAHQQRSPQEYRVAMAPLSAPRTSERGSAQNMQSAPRGLPSGQQPSRSSGGSQATQSGGHQATSSGGHQATQSGGHQATSSGSGHQATSSSGHQGKSSGGGQQARSSGGQTDHKEKKG